MRCATKKYVYTFGILKLTGKNISKIRTFDMPTDAEAHASLRIQRIRGKYFLNAVTETITARKFTSDHREMALN